MDDQTTTVPSPSPAVSAQPTRRPLLDSLKSVARSFLADKRKVALLLGVLAVVVIVLVVVLMSPSKPIVLQRLTNTVGAKPQPPVEELELNEVEPGTDEIAGKKFFTSPDEFDELWCKVRPMGVCRQEERTDESVKFLWEYTVSNGGFAGELLVFKLSKTDDGWTVTGRGVYTRCFPDYGDTEWREGGNCREPI